MTHFLVLLLALLIGVSRRSAGPDRPRGCRVGRDAGLDQPRRNLGGVARASRSPSPCSPYWPWVNLSPTNCPRRRAARPRCSSSPAWSPAALPARSSGRRGATPWADSAPASIGAVLGTLGGYEARRRLVAANGGTRPADRAGRGCRRRAGWPRRRGADILWSRWQAKHKRFDAIIVGAGQAGPPLAGRLTAAGQTVAVIERKLIGGTCVNYRLHPDQDAGGQRARGASGPPRRGIRRRHRRISPSTWRRSRPARTRSCSTTAHGVESWLEGMDGCTLIRGHARFESPTHHPGGRAGPRGRPDLPQRRRPGGGRPTCRGCPTSTI